MVHVHRVALLVKGGTDWKGRGGGEAHPPPLSVHSPVRQVASHRRTVVLELFSPHLLLPFICSASSSRVEEVNMFRCLTIEALEGPHKGCGGKFMKKEEKMM